jgi:acid phosphatase (class A)
MTSRSGLSRCLGKALPAAAFVLVAAARVCAAHFAEFTAGDVLALVPPPPASRSLVEQSELEVVLQLQRARTDAQAKRAAEIDGEDIFYFGRDALGSGFTAENYPLTAGLFAALREDFLALNRTAKAAFSRRRPPFVDSRVQPALRVSDSGSYPSGHGMQSALWCAILGELAPEHRATFEERARESRWSRLLAGVHFPSDVEAGRVIGEAFAKKVISHPDFQRRLQLARGEFRRRGN